MLWDTAGQEEFDAITKAYYRGAHACVLAFSTTDRDSFLALHSWKLKVIYKYIYNFCTFKSVIPNHHHVLKNVGTCRMPLALFSSNNWLIRRRLRVRSPKYTICVIKMLFVHFCACLLTNLDTISLSHWITLNKQSIGSGLKDHSLFIWCSARSIHT